MDKHYGKFLFKKFLKLLKKKCLNFQTNTYLILCRGDEIQEMMKLIERAFNKLMENKIELIQQILTKQSDYMKKFEKACHYFFVCFLFFAATTPFFEKHLTCQIFLPGFDESLYEYNTVYFWLFYVIQNMLMYYALTSFKFYICLIVNFIHFGTTMLKVLKLKVRALRITKKTLMEMEKLDSKLTEEIMSCIKMHIEIKE